MKLSKLPIILFVTIIISASAFFGVLFSQETPEGNNPLFLSASLARKLNRTSTKKKKVRPLMRSVPKPTIDIHTSNPLAKIEVPYEEHGALWSLQSGGSAYSEALTTPLIYGPNPLNDPLRCCTFRSMKDAMRTIYRFGNYTYQWKNPIVNKEVRPSIVPRPLLQEVRSIPRVSEEQLNSLREAFRRYRELSVDDNQTLVVPAYVVACVGNADCWEIPKHLTMFGHPRVALGYFIFVINSNDKEHLKLGENLHKMFPRQFLYLTRTWYRKPTQFEFGSDRDHTAHSEPSFATLPSGRRIDLPDVSLHPFETISDDHRNAHPDRKIYPRMGFSQTFNMALNMLFGRHVIYPPPFVMMGNADYYFTHTGIEMFLNCLYGKLNAAINRSTHFDENPMTTFWETERRKALGDPSPVDSDILVEEFFEGEDRDMRRKMNIPVATPIQRGQRVNLDTQEMKDIRRARYQRIHASQGLPPRSTEHPADFPTVVQFETYSMIGFTYYAWKTFGMFHENRYPAYGEDTDMRKNAVSQGFPPNDVCYDAKRYPPNHIQTIRRHGESQSLRTPGLGQMVDRYRRSHQTLDRWHLLDDVNKYDTIFSNAWDMEQPSAEELYMSFFATNVNTTDYEHIILKDIAVNDTQVDPHVLCDLLAAIKHQATGVATPRWGRVPRAQNKRTAPSCDVQEAAYVAKRFATALSQVPLSRNSHGIDLVERKCLMTGKGPKDPDNQAHCAFDRRIALSYLRPVFTFQ